MTLCFLSTKNASDLSAVQYSAIVQTFSLTLFSLLKVSQMFGQKAWQVYGIGTFSLCMQPLLIVVNLLYSTWGQVTCRVLHGFIFQSVPFNIFIGGLQKMKECVLTEFADVTKLWGTNQYARGQGCCTEGLGTGWRNGPTL